MTYAVEFDNVSRLYGDVRAVDGVSIAIKDGEFFSMLGPSGSGKTTLLNCIATIDRPTSGSVIIDGTDITHMRSRQLAQFRREQLGFIFQDSNLLDTLSCRENIALPLTIAHVRASEIDDRVVRIATALGVNDVLEKFPYQVSGGQKQRVAIARALAMEPEVLLFD